MDWIQTYTGRQFRPLKPRLEDIDIRDIAHSLSQLCRFNGHCHTFYSVAEHSVRVSLAVPSDSALWGLLHDAAEAYMTDLPRPVKQQLPQYSAIEDRLLRVIVESFGLSWPMPPSVRQADDQLLVTEGRDVMGPPPEPWSFNAMPLSQRIEPMTALQAEQAFLERFRRLTGKTS